MKFISRKEYHAKKGKKVFGKDDCPFCYDDEFLIWTGKYWKIFHNKSSYSGDERNLLAVPKRHIIYSTDLKKEEFEELAEVHKFMKKFFGEENYFSFTRETMWSRSVEHLHIHFLAGRLQGKFLRKMLEGQGFPIEEDLKI